MHFLLKLLYFYPLILFYFSSLIKFNNFLWHVTRLNTVTKSFIYSNFTSEPNIEINLCLHTIES